MIILLFLELTCNSKTFCWKQSYRKEVHIFLATCFAIALLNVSCEKNGLNRASDRVRPKIGNCAALRRSIVQQKRPIVRQSIANLKYFGGLLNGVLIGISVYLGNGINIIR